MAAKKRQLFDAEHAKRIREAAKRLETRNDPKDFERAIGKGTAAASPKKENPSK